MTREAQAQVQQAIAEKKSNWGWQVDYQRRSPELSNMVSLQVSFPLRRVAAGPNDRRSQAQVRQLEDE
nr:hypothetical protein [Pseudomonas sp. NBRC 111124]